MRQHSFVKMTKCVELYLKKDNTFLIKISKCVEITMVETTHLNKNYQSMLNFPYKRQHSFDEMYKCVESHSLETAQL